jgi:hypothetical protein
MSPDGIWVPGAPQPSLEDFVGRLHKHIERFANEHGEGQVAVEIELRDGAVLSLLSIQAEPGYGFVTLAPHREDGKTEEMIVPMGAIACITLGPVEEQPPFGFGPPAAATA